MRKEEHIFTNRNTAIHELIAVPRKITDESTGDALDLIVIHDTQTIESLSGDLQTSRWSYGWPKFNTEDLGARFDFATLANAQDLQAGLLANAYEAAAAVQAWSSTNILVLIRADRRKNSQRLRWTLSLMKVPQTAGERVAIYDVQRLKCPRQLDIQDASTRAVFQVQSRSGRIFAKLSQSLVQWNAKNMQLTGQLTYKNELVSFLPLGYAELLTSRENKCSVVDLEWQTMQCEFVLSQKPETPSKTGSKRGRDSGITTFAESTFIEYFSSAGIAVASRSGSLFAIPISFAGNKRQRTGPRTLAETVGKIATEESRLGVSAEVPEAFADSVRDFVKENKIADLEEFFAKDLDLSYERVALEDDGYARKRIFVETDEATNQDVVFWTLPKDDSTMIKRTDWNKAKLVYEQIFTRSKSSGRLKIRFYSPSIYEWLAVVGLFTTRVENGPQPHNHGTASEVAVGLAKADPSLSLLGEFLSWSNHLDLDAVVSALDIAIESLDTQAEQPGLQLTNGTSDQVAPAEDSSIEHASRAAEDDLALALVSLDEGMAIRGDVLRSIFDRLSAFEDGPITKAFSKHLSPRKLVFLINLLRIELADGGWTTRYMDEIHEDNEDAYADTADQSIRIIIKLLNTAIDAVGPTGWNVSLSSDKQLNSDEMLLILRAEITAVLEGSQEIQAIGAAIQDFAKYSSEVKPIQSLQKQKELYSVHKTGFVRDETQDALLPMGATVDKVELTRTSKGGKVSVKSKGAIGQELSMRVGKYSLDKIRV